MLRQILPPPLRATARYGLDELRLWWRRSPLSRSHTDFVRFVIIAPGRSGSGLLVSYLASHPEIVSYNEVLNNRTVVWGRGHKRGASPARWQEMDADPAAFVRRHVWHPQPQGVRAVGFKVITTHLLSSRLVTALQMILADETIRVILQDRHNQLASFLSLEHARREEVWAATDAATPQQRPPLALDAAELDLFFRNRDKVRTIFRQLTRRHRTMESWYEDTVEAPDAEGVRLCSFLGVREMPLTSPLKKQGSGDLRHAIANYDELRDRFAGTPWAAFFPADGLEMPRRAA